MNTPCAGQSELFDSTFHTDHARARAMCLNSCPALDWCKGRLQDTQQKSVKDGGPTGTWAGRLLRVTSSREAVA